MAEIRDHYLYREDTESIGSLEIPWKKLNDKTVWISGGSGMIGMFLIDALMYQNLIMNRNIRIIATGRDEERAKARLGLYWDNSLFSFQRCDVNYEIPFSGGHIDYVIHAASNTHPLQYSTDPIGTILTNIMGTKNVLDYAYKSEASRTVFLSSVEVYGENRGDIDYFDESYCGFIDCNTLRAGYPEGKRAGESLCQAYRKQNGMDIVIPRLSRTYGPTMQMSDSKAIAQFIKNGVAKENIVLKSKGDQLYSYSYVADAVSGILYVILKGKDGDAYNIADTASDITLKDMADLIAAFCGTDVIFEMPDQTEKAGYSKATKAILNSDKLKQIGWKAKYSIEEGLRRTIEVLSLREL